MIIGMDKRIQINPIQNQDTVRQNDMRRMNPVDRVKALVEMRDNSYPYTPFDRSVQIRQLKIPQLH